MIAVLCVSQAMRAHASSGSASSSAHVQSLQPLGFALHCPVLVTVPSEPLPLKTRQYWVAASHFASAGESGQSNSTSLAPLAPLVPLELLLLVEPLLPLDPLEPLLLLAPLELLLLLLLSPSEEQAATRRIEARVPAREMPEWKLVISSATIQCKVQSRQSEPKRRLGRAPGTIRRERTLRTQGPSCPHAGSSVANRVSHVASVTPLGATGSGFCLRSTWSSPAMK